MWRAVCTAAGVGPNTRAGIAIAIWVRAIATRISAPDRRVASLESAALLADAARIPGARSGWRAPATAAAGGGGSRRRGRRCGSRCSRRGGRRPWPRRNRVLTVEPGRDRVAHLHTGHTRESTPGLGSSPVSSVAVDELTRLFLAARDGDARTLRGARQPGRRVAPRPSPGGSRRGRRRHPGHVRARGSLPSFGATPRPHLVASIARRLRRRCALGAPPPDPERAERHAVGGAGVRATADRGRTQSRRCRRAARDQRVRPHQIVGCSYARRPRPAGPVARSVRGWPREQLVETLRASETG
jgi:hypothetical protein